MVVPVYYDPNDPSVGVLKTGVPPLHLELMVGLAVVGAISAIAAIFVVRGWYLTWKKPADPLVA
jgi:hypothetical protein